METTQASLGHLTRENPMGEARKDALRLACRSTDYEVKWEIPVQGSFIPEKIINHLIQGEMHDLKDSNCFVL